MPPISDSTTPPADTGAVAGEWKARPVLAWLVRAALIVVPLVVSWLCVRFAMRVVTRPGGVLPTVLWFLGAVLLSSIVFQLVRRVIGRFSSLGILFSLSLTFPDTAPSRMRAFLGSGRDDAASRLDIYVDSEFDAEMMTKRLAALVAKVSRREARSGRHGDRVRGYAELIARELGLDEDEIERLRWATLLHDVGLLDVPQRVLDSKGGLTAEDREIVERHPIHAIGHLKPFASWLGPWVGAATEHHERWDGTGYPAGLAGEEISLAGRIVAVADAYDAMTALRSYRKPISSAAARHELVDKSGSQFDPTVVRAFLEVGIDENRAGLGALGAIVEVPGQLLTLVGSAGAGAGAGAGVAVASAVVVATTAAVVPAISTDVEQPARRVERRVAETIDAPTTTTTDAPTSTTRAPTTTRRPTTTVPTTTTTTTTTTMDPTTTSPATTLPPATSTTTTTTAVPLPPPTTTTTTTAAPLPPPTTTTVTLPPYPTITTTTVTLPPYPSV